MAQADIYIRFPAVDINTRRLKFSIFSCSLDFYMMIIKGKMFCQTVPEAVARIKRRIIFFFFRQDVNSPD